MLKELDEFGLIERKKQGLGKPTIIYVKDFTRSRKSELLDSRKQNSVIPQTGTLDIKNMSAYIRKMAIDGYIVRLDLSDVNEVARLLHINSNNLNQYAKQANTNGSIYYGDIQKLKRQHEELCGLLKAIYQRLLSI